MDLLKIEIDLLKQELEIDLKFQIEFQKYLNQFFYI